EGLVGVEAPGAGDQQLRQVMVDAPVARTIGIGQRAMRDGRTKPQPVELVLARAQANFYVGQAISVSQLGEGHGQELVPARELVSLIVAVITLHTAAKLLGVNPLRQLRKNQFSSGHGPSLAYRLLRKTPNWSLIRSHARSRVYRSRLAYYIC